MRTREIRQRARTRCQTVWSNAVAAAKAGGTGAIDDITTTTPAILVDTDTPVNREREEVKQRQRKEPTIATAIDRYTSVSAGGAGDRVGHKEEDLIIIDHPEEGDTWTRPLLDVCEEDVTKAIEQRLDNRRKTPGPTQGTYTPFRYTLTRRLMSVIYTLIANENVPCTLTLTTTFHHCTILA